MKEAYLFALLCEEKFQSKAIARKSSFTLRSLPAPFYSLPLVSFTPVPPPVRQEAKKLQTVSSAEARDTLSVSVLHAR